MRKVDGDARKRFVVCCALSVSLLAPVSVLACLCTDGLGSELLWPAREVYSAQSFIAVHEGHRFEVADAEGPPCSVTHRMTLIQPTYCRPEIEVVEVECDEAVLPLHVAYRWRSGRWDVGVLSETMDELSVVGVLLSDSHEYSCVYPDVPLRTATVMIERPHIPVLATTVVDGLRFGTYIGPDWVQGEFEVPDTGACIEVVFVDVLTLTELASTEACPR